MSAPPNRAHQFPPKLEDGSYDRDLVKQMFMDSPFIDWTRFAESQGWDAHFTRRQFAVQAWQKEKKLITAENQADKLAALLFDRRYAWHADVLQTIEDFPKFADQMKMIINARMSQMGSEYKEYVELLKLRPEVNSDPIKKKDLEKTIKSCAWNQYSNGDIAALTAAVTQIGDFKYRTLMLKNWTIDKAVLDTDPAKLSEIEQSGGVTFLVQDVEFTTEGVQKLMDEYLDKPAGTLDGKD